MTISTALDAGICRAAPDTMGPARGAEPKITPQTAPSDRKSPGCPFAFCWRWTTCLVSIRDQPTYKRALLGFALASMFPLVGLFTGWSSLAAELSIFVLITALAAMAGGWPSALGANLSIAGAILVSGIPQQSPPLTFVAFTFLFGTTAATALSEFLEQQISRRRRDRAAAERCRIFMEFVEQSPSAMALFDRDMRYLAKSSRWCHDYGLSESPIGRIHYDVFPDIPERWRTIHQLGLAGTASHEDEDPYQRADGTVQWLRWSVRPWHTESGTVGGIVIHTEDITDKKLTELALKESEHRFRWALVSAGGGAWDWDLDSDVAWWSAEMYELWGIPPGTTMTSDNSMSCVLPQDRPMLSAAVEDCIAGRAALFAEFRIEHPRKGRRWMASHARMSRASNGLSDASPRLLGLTFDITDRKRAEQALAEVRRFDALGQLASSIAHDTNNLLSVISGNLQLALERAENERVKTWLQRAVDAAEAGATQNRRLLTIASNRRLEPRTIDINVRIRDTARLLERMLGTNITVELTLDPQYRPVLIDIADCDSALLNLALNARDAMPDGGILTFATQGVTLDASAIPGANKSGPADYVRVSVSDNGIGMEPEVLARAGEPMFTTKPPGKGTGLGLASIKSFVQRSGGFMTLSSTPGKGTTVTLNLPVRTTSDEACPRTSEAAMAAPRAR